MTYKKRKSKFDDTVQQAYLVAQEWAMSVADQVPVPLQKLANEKRILRIRFEPLISTSGLVKNEDGFDIVVNTEAPGTTQKEKAGTVQEINNSDWSIFASPLLFNIAHEIAHVIFIDVVGGITKKRFLRDHEDELETACSKMARMLLIPKQRLIREIEGRLFDVNHIEGLIKLFKVSPKVFIWRLQLDDMKDVFKDADGLLVYAEVEQGHIVIKAYQIWGPQAKSRFATLFAISALNKQKNLPEELVLRELHLVDDINIKFDEINARLLENEKGQIKLQVPCASDTLLPGELNFCRIQGHSDRLLIGIKVAGNIEKRGLKNLI